MIHSSLRRKLVHETKWSRTYEVEPGYYAYESKFEADDLSVALSEVSSGWDSWTDTEKLDFAKAFEAKTLITVPDEQVLEFLMTHGDERVLSSIAICLTRHPNKAIVLHFLLAQLESGSEPKANFLQALNMLGDRAAVPSIKALHDHLAVELKRAGKDPNGFLITDFFASCAAIDRLEGTTTYRAEIEPFLSHPNGSIGAMAKLWIAGGPPSQ